MENDGICRFGITGQVASGKSTVAACFCALGVPVIDLDKMMYDVFVPGTAVHRKILEMLGESVLDCCGMVDTVKLSLMICREKWISEFLDEVMENEMESIVCKIDNVFSCNGLCAWGLESMNMMRPCLRKHIGPVVVVECDDENRMERLMARSNLSREVANKIVRNKKQFDLDDGCFVLDNSGDLDSMNDRLGRFFDEHPEMKG